MDVSFQSLKSSSGGSGNFTFFLMMTSSLSFVSPYFLLSFLPLSSRGPSLSAYGNNYTPCNFILKNLRCNRSRSKLRVIITGTWFPGERVFTAAPRGQIPVRSKRTYGILQPKLSHKFCFRNCFCGKLLESSLGLYRHRKLWEMCVFLVKNWL